MNKVIFTDFDGVLHPVDAGEVVTINGEWDFVGEDLFCWAPLLWRLISPHDVGIVIHSSWRRTYSLAELKRRFPPEMRDGVVGITEGPGRWGSILRYVAHHRVGQYLVLDDMPEEFPPNWEPLVVCDEALGISPDPIQERIRRFAAKG